MYASMPSHVFDTFNSLITPPLSSASIDTPPPRLSHTLHHLQKSSVLSLAADACHIFSGCQTGDIYVRPIDQCVSRVLMSVL